MQPQPPVVESIRTRSPEPGPRLKEERLMLLSHALTLVEARSYVAALAASALTSEAAM